MTEFFELLRRSILSVLTSKLPNNEVCMFKFFPLDDLNYERVKAMESNGT